VSDWRQNFDTKFALDVRRVAGQASFYRKKCLTAQNKRVLQEQSILLAKISEFVFVEAHAKGRVLRSLATSFQTSCRMISYVPEPLDVARITLIPRLAHAGLRYDPLKLCALIDQKDVAERFDVGNAVRHSVDAIGDRNRLSFMDVRTVLTESLCGA